MVAKPQQQHGGINSRVKRNSCPRDTRRPPFLAHRVPRLLPGMRVIGIRPSRSTFTLFLEVIEVRDTRCFRLLKRNKCAAAAAALRCLSLWSLVACLGAAKLEKGRAVRRCQHRRLSSECARAAVSPRSAVRKLILFSEVAAVQCTGLWYYR